jgi:hypothetical protein
MGISVVIFVGKSRLITTGTTTLRAAIATPVTIVPKYRRGQPLRTRNPEAKVSTARKKKMTTSGERVRAEGLTPRGAAAPKHRSGIAVSSEIAASESPRSGRAADLQRQPRGQVVALCANGKWEFLPSGQVLDAKPRGNAWNSTSVHLKDTLALCTRRPFTPRFERVESLHS